MQVQMCSFLKVKKAKRGGVLSSTGTVVQYKDRTEWSRMKNGNRTDRARRFVGVGYGSTADFRSRRTQGQSGLAPSNFFFLQYAAVEFIMQKLRLSMLHAG